MISRIEYEKQQAAKFEADDKARREQWAEQQRRAAEQQRRAAEAAMRAEEERRRLRSTCFVVRNDPASTPQQRGACDEFFADEAARERYHYWLAEFQQRQRMISAQQAHAEAQQQATAEAQRQARVALFLQALGQASPPTPAYTPRQTVQTDCYRIGSGVHCTSR